MLVSQLRHLCDTSPLDTAKPLNRQFIDGFVLLPWEWLALVGIWRTTLWNQSSRCCFTGGRGMLSVSHPYNIAVLRVLLGIIVEHLGWSAGSHPLTHSLIIQLVPGLRAAARNQSEREADTHTQSTCCVIALPVPRCPRTSMSTHAHQHFSLGTAAGLFSLCD